MPIVKNIEKRIWDVEGFDVRIRHQDGRDLRDDKSGLPMYPYDRAAKNDMTVSEWRERRFNRYYPGFHVDVLIGTGEDAAGNSKIGTVRDSYSEED